MDIFSIIRGLEITSEDLLEAEVFSEQYLSSKFPDYDFRVGTAIRDMVVRPNAVLIASVKKALDYYFEGTDVTDITDDTPSDVVDKRLSNFFITRKSGNQSIVRARLFFSFPQSEPAAIIIPSSAYFSTDNELKFYLSEAITVLQSDFTYDASEGLWFYDVDLYSDKADELYNKETGDLLYFTLFSPYMVKGEILYLKQYAVSQETNTDMVKRSYSSISTRNLINDPSIESKIQDNFSYVKNVKVVGMGDPDMSRDLVNIDGVDIHIGGHVDVLCNTEIVEDTRQYTVDEFGAIEIEGPVLEVTRSFLEGYLDSIDAAAPYTVSVDADEFGLSSKQTTRVNMILSAGTTATFTSKVLVGVGSIQDWMDLPDNRVVLANYLVRAFQPIMIKVDIVSPFDIPSDCESRIKSYVDSIPEGGTIYKSGIFNAIVDSGLTDFSFTDSKVWYQLIPRGGLLTDTWTELTDTYEATAVSNFKLLGVNL
jgi:hypothetical protein